MVNGVNVYSCVQRRDNCKDRKQTQSTAVEVVTIVKIVRRHWGMRRLRMRVLKKMYQEDGFLEMRS